MTISLTLPWPPSVNNLYKNVGRRRVRTPAYRKWQEEAGWHLQAARPPKLSGPVEVTLELCPPDNRRADADNRNKAVLDLLVTHGVIAGDDRRFVKSVTARWVENAVHSCVVTIAQLETARTFDGMEPVLFAGMRTPKVGT
jgi:crossover junction endodeoxyribonuclease RusA